MFSLCRLLGKEVSIPWKHARIDKIALRKGIFQGENAPGTPWDKPIGDTIHLPSSDSFIHFSRHTTVFETQKVCAASWQAQKQHIPFIHKPGMLSLVSSLVQFSLVFKICLPPQTYNYVASFMSPLCSVNEEEGYLLPLELRKQLFANISTECYSHHQG